MSGRLVLTTPWTRQYLPPDWRPEVEAEIPEGTFLNVGCGSHPGRPWKFRLLTEARDHIEPGETEPRHTLLWGPMEVYMKDLRQAALFALRHHAKDAVA